MLRIRKEQMGAFRQHLRDQFVVQMVTHLREGFPDETCEMDAPALRAFINRGIDAAKDYGVVKRGDVRDYLECMLVLGPDFDRSPRTPWAGQILRDDGLDGTQKMRAIGDLHVRGSLESR